MKFGTKFERKVASIIDKLEVTRAKLIEMTEELEYEDDDFNSNEIENLILSLDLYIEELEGLYHT
tara:strand:+ start:19 stop:213 length:195 start_codon:yes stop_codon:yes gene_type:complete